MKCESRMRAALSIIFSVTLVAGLWPLPNAGATSQVQDASDPAAAVVEVREADASAVEASDPVEDASAAVLIILETSSSDALIRERYTRAS